MRNKSDQRPFWAVGALITFLVVIAGIAKGQSIAPPNSGTWQVTITYPDNTDQELWSFSGQGQGRSMRRTLVQTSNRAKQHSVGQQIRYAASLGYRTDGSWEYQWGVGSSSQRASCTFKIDSFNCPGLEINGSSRYPITIDGVISGAPPKIAVKLPIIFLPGVAGTRLMVSWTDEGSTYLHSTEAWPFSPAEQRDRLRLDEFGKTGPANTTVKADLLLSTWPTNFYGGIRDFLHKKGYLASGGAAQEPRQYFEFPYDWRLDNGTHFEALDRKIDAALKENPKATKVMLMAHSMGGVIARAYILSSPQRAARVDSLITIGTPYWGAPKPYYGATNGYTFGNPSVLQPLMKKLIQNWPAAYQLMPNYQFIWDGNEKRWLTVEEASQVRYKWFASIDENWFAADKYTETTDNIKSLNPNLVKLAQDFKKPFGTRENPTPLPPGIRHYAIVGTGVKTFADINMNTASYMDAGLSGRQLNMGGRKVEMWPCFHDGDGTVSLEGSVISTATTYYVPYVAKWGFDSSSGHGDLPANSTVQKIVGDIVDGKPPDPNSYSYNKKKEGELIDLEEGVDFRLHSDVRLSIKDAETGRILGFTDSDGIEENFPSGSFIAMNDGEYAAIADTKRPLTAMVRGIRNGKFTLEVNIRKRGEPARRFAFKEVAVTSGTMAQVSLTPANVGSDLPALSVTTAGQTNNVQASVLPPLDENHPGLTIQTERGGQASSAGTFLGSIPQHGGTVTSFKFFTTDDDLPPPQSLRQYQTRFPKASLKTVFYELSVKYVAENETAYMITSIWRSAREAIARQDLPMSKPMNWNTSTGALGYGNREPGKWEVGTYTVDIEVAGRKVASGSFTVY